MSYKILTGSQITIDYLPKIMALDIEVYSNYKMEGCLEQMEKRFRANQETFVVLENEDNGELVGYINFFPIKKELYNEIAYTSKKIRDDDIEPEEMGEYKNGCHIFILSVAIRESYRERGACKILSNAWIDYINQLADTYNLVERNGKSIAKVFMDISGITISKDGEKFLSRYSFESERIINENEKFYLCEKYNLIEFLTRDTIIIEQTKKYDDKKTNAIINDILEIEKEVYKGEYQSSFENIKKRVQKFPEQFFLAKESDKIVGYFRFLPISDILYENIINEDKIYYDDINNINEKDVVSINEVTHLLLLSVAIKEKYQNKGIANKFMRTFELYFRNGKIRYDNIEDIVTYPIMTGGEEFITKYGYKSFKEFEKIKIFQKRITKKDIFILVPVSGKFDIKTEVPKEDAPFYSKKYIKEIDNINEIGINTIPKINRYILHNVNLLYYPDEEYRLKTDKKYDTVTANVIISYQEKTELGLITLIISECKIDPTYFGDVILEARLIIEKENKYLLFKDYINEKYKLELCGKARAIYCTGKDELNLSEKEYLLTGEKINSKWTAYKIKNEDTRKIAETNLASYDSYELYVSDKATLLLGTDKYKYENFPKNIKNEKLLLFICEIAMLRKAAIYRINSALVDALDKDSDISAITIRNLQVKFGKTVRLWDANIYNYSMAQRISDKITEALGTQNLYNEYIKNKTHAEHIAKVKNTIFSSFKDIVITILGLIITVKQLIDPILEKDAIKTLEGFIFLIFTIMLLFFLCSIFPEEFEMFKQKIKKRWNVFIKKDS